MKDEKLLQQIKEIERLRIAIDATGPAFAESKVKSDVQRVYGRSVGRTTWHRWKVKCGIEAELLARYDGNYPAGAYLLLMVNAKLSRGNGPHERSRKVTRPMLVAAVKAHRHKTLSPRPENLPEELSRNELVAVVEAQANRQYHIRTHEKRGIKRRKNCYSRAEAIEILSAYPTFAIGA